MAEPFALGGVAVAVRFFSICKDTANDRNSATEARIRVDIAWIQQVRGGWVLVVPGRAASETRNFIHL
jgi:hypothetical protein